MVQYKVVKEFACAKKGDILTWNEETEMYEFTFKNETSERALFMDKDTCDEYVDEGYMITVDDKDECSCDEVLMEELGGKIDAISTLVDTLLEQYEKDHKALIDAYNNQEIPTCVKVESDTVYYNLTKVLTKIKDIINE